MKTKNVVTGTDSHVFSFLTQCLIARFGESARKIFVIPMRSVKNGVCFFVFCCVLIGVCVSCQPESIEPIPTPNPAPDTIEVNSYYSNAANFSIWRVCDNDTTKTGGELHVSHDDVLTMEYLPPKEYETLDFATKVLIYKWLYTTDEQLDSLLKENGSISLKDLVIVTDSVMMPLSSSYYCYSTECDISNLDFGKYKFECAAKYSSKYLSIRDYGGITIVVE